MFGKSSEQRAAERFLETPLPPDATGVRFLFYKPGSEQDTFTAYLKFACSSDSYLAFAQQLGLKTDAEEVSPHLPAAWGLPSQITLDWWDPLPATPDNAAARSLRNGGWLVAKYERGHVFLSAAGGG